MSDRRSVLVAAVGLRTPRELAVSPRTGDSSRLARHLVRPRGSRRRLDVKTIGKVPAGLRMLDNV